VEAIKPPRVVKAVVIDLGTSLIKTLYYYRDQYHFLPHPSFIAPLNKSLYEDAIKAPDGKTNYVWLGDKGYMVGRQAAREYEQVDVSLKKTEAAIAKVLSVVGQIKHEMAAEIELRITRLVLLLPYVEIAEQDRVAKATKAALGQFEFNGRPHSIAVDELLVKWEGYGFSKLSDEEQAVFTVFGQKDLTIGALSLGQLVRPWPKTLVGQGMTKVIERVEYTFKSHVYAAKAISQYRLKPSTLRNYVVGDQLEAVAKSIDKAIENTWFEYEQEFKTNPAVRDAVIFYVTGGSSLIWKDHLREFNKSKGRKFQPLNHVAEELAGKIPELKGDPMVYRITDAYLTLKWLTHAWRVI
jgi:hypothetical protein